MRHNDTALAERISQSFADIYFHCRPTTALDSLSHQAVRVLALLDRDSSVTVAAVAKHLGTAQNTASEIVARLAARKLVTKTRKPGDERTVVLALTPAGQRAVDEQTKLSKPKLAKALESLSQKERAALDAAFALLADHLREAP